MAGELPLGAGAPSARLRSRQAVAPCKVTELRASVGRAGALSGYHQPDDW
ncbi:MAG: hypothetical protein QOG53_3130 [Frankiales bacterium]|jgi:hypothetical protein|nr:hypothetical protein [Frankiales bacterium]